MRILHLFSNYKWTGPAEPALSLALGLRAGCPIRVAEDVLEQVRTDLGPDTLPPDGAEEEEEEEE